MSDIDVVEVRQALRLVAKDVEIPRDLAARVRHGGRRRVRRRRVAAIGGVLAVTLAGVAGITNLAERPAPAPETLGDQLMSQPTRGDLAGDKQYLREVLSTYVETRDQTPLAGLGVTEHPVGPAHVAWAGNTPAGPAAAVVQRTKVPSKSARGGPGSGQIGGDTGVLIKFIGTAPSGRPEAVGTDYFGHHNYKGNSLAFLVGRDRSVLVVLDVGAALDFSTRRTYTTTTISRIDWAPLRFADGAAVLTVSPQRGRYSVAVREHNSGDYVGVGNLTDPAEQPGDRGLDWSTPPNDKSPVAQPARFPVNGADPSLADCWHECAGADTYRKLLGSGAPPGLEPQANLAVAQDWIAYGKTPSGSLFIACDLRVGSDPTRSMIVIEGKSGQPTTLYGPPVERSSPLPVLIELPDQEGWLVARKNARLEYRVGAHDWVDAGKNASLLSAEATAVRVDGTEVGLR
ncbi:hypothetical protein [Micromonospora globbae]|uniref:hypothetical protein n=1 Tax=Micromonospora globbae TaxID=1894969 RepID=UPI003448EBE3|nr:hypothetical protein OH732_01655 [Micromonospora globbae]